MAPRPLSPGRKMAVQLRRAGRFRAGLGVEVHHRDYPHVRPGQQGTRVVRVLPAVKEDQVARMRPDDGAVPFHAVDVGRVRVMRENEFAAGPAG